MRRIVLIPLLLLLASCSSRQSLFVVLPNPDGSSGAVTIENGQNSVLLDHPYAAGEVRGGVAASVKVDQAQVQRSADLQRFIDQTGIVPERDLDAAAFARDRPAAPSLSFGKAGGRLRAAHQLVAARFAD